MPELLVPGVHEYRIIRGPDLSLQFDPPTGSLELANALSYKYPLEPDLKSKMQRAILDHLTGEQQSIPDTSPDSMPSTFSANGTGSMDSSANTTWDVTTGNPPQKKRKKSAYSDMKRQKVARVRKRGACPSCKRRKVECTHTPVDDRQTRQQSEDETTTTITQLDKPALQPDTSLLPALEASHQGTYELSSLSSSLNNYPSLDNDWTNYDFDFSNDFWRSSQGTVGLTPIPLTDNDNNSSYEHQP